MRVPVLVMVLLSLLGCGRRGQPDATKVADDAIARLVTRLSAEGEWDNGMFRGIALPETAAPADVVAEILHARPTILQVRQVRIGSGEGRPFTAVQLKTDQGSKIVLMRYAADVGWWNRTFDEGS